MTNENEKKSLIKVKNYRVKIVKKKQNPIRFTLSVLSYALFIWLLLIGATLLVYMGDKQVRALKGDHSPSKFNAYVVKTGSMLPSIKVNDVVVTKKVDASELEKGDIITFISSDKRISGESVTHRITEIYIDPNTKEYSYQTKGDANNTVDWTLAYDYNVLGKVILKLPYIGYIKFFLGSKGGWIIGILIPCVAILSYDIVKLFKLLGIKTKKVKK